MPGKGGRPPFVPSKIQRGMVLALSANGLAQKQIATYLQISPMTLRKAFKKELVEGFDYIYAALSGSLVQKALAGDKTCIIFWLKVHAGWRETSRHEVTGADGKPISLENLDSDALREILDAIEAIDGSGVGQIAPGGSGA